MITPPATIAATAPRPGRNHLVSGVMLAAMAATVVVFVLHSSTFRTAYWTLAGLVHLRPRWPLSGDWLTGIDPVTGPIVALVALVGLWSTWPLSRILEDRWLPDADRPTCWALAMIITTSAFLVSVQVLAFARLFGWIPGMPIPAISAIFMLMLWLSGRLLARRQPAVACPAVCRNRRWLPSGTRLPLAFVLSAHGICLLMALSGPPIGGGDALRYHLPLVVKWMRADALIMQPEFWQYALPSNGEVIIWWFLRGGLESVAGIALFPAGLLAAATTWGLVRHVQGSRFAAATAVIGVLVSEVVADQMCKSFIDLFGTAFLAAGILALMIGSEPGRIPGQKRLLALLGGLALGISCGSKPVFWLLALLATVILGVLRVRRADDRRCLRTLAPLFLAGLAACSAFWFVRASVEAGNPLYPLRLSIAGHEVLPGVSPERLIDRPSLRDQLTSPPNLARLPGRIGLAILSVDGYESDFPPLSVAIILAGILAVGLSSAARRQALARPNRAVIAGLALAMLVALVLVLQFRTRYGMIYHLLALCWASLAIAHLHRRRPRITAAVLAAATGTACICTLAGPLDSLLYRLHTGDMSRAAFYRVPSTIDTLPAGSRLVSLATNARALNYPLYGRGLRNDVIDSLTAGSLFPDLRPSIAELEQAGIEYVYLRAPFPEGWDTARNLELIYDDELDPRRPRRTLPSRIYRVPKDTHAAGPG
ncbi:MAG: hypothetical protein KA354_12900 [Phycisphaerae bacterium]|nr:hypothetical protein [Phycisphaerae bacterium]